MIEIPLRDKQGETKAVALIDDDDFLLADLRWHLSSKGYAVRNVWDRTGEKPICRTYFLHRMVLGLTRDNPAQGDHVSRNKLDCRRKNLRVISDAENRHNVPARGGYSQHRGVSRHGGKWIAQVRADGVLHQLGRFDSEYAAAMVAKAGRKRLLVGAVD